MKLSELSRPFLAASASASTISHTARGTSVPDALVSAVTGRYRQTQAIVIDLEPGKFRATPAAGQVFRENLAPWAEQQLAHTPRRRA